MFYPIPITHQRIHFYLMLINVKILLSKLSYKVFYLHVVKNYSQYLSFITMKIGSSVCVKIPCGEILSWVNPSRFFRLYLAL